MTSVVASLAAHRERRSAEQQLARIERLLAAHREELECLEICRAQLIAGLKRELSMEGTDR